MTSKLRVGILGATGMAGQRYVQLLDGHPWFEVAWLAASEQSAGRTYREATAGRWHMETEPPVAALDLPVHRMEDVKDAAASCSLVFSAVSTAAAQQWEEVYAKAGLAVVSNASAHRWDTDVPVVIPEINPDHLDIIPRQQKARGFKPGGLLVCKPNCSVQSYLLPLHVLRDYGLRRVVVTTMQALSGAGYPGVPSLAATENVIPFIGGEEDKSEQEPLKVFGAARGGAIVAAKGIKIAAHCNRVPTIDGHMACVSVEFDRKPAQSVIRKRWAGFVGLPQEVELPSAPRPAIMVREEEDRPQPRRDRDAGRGMAVTVGRLRPCPVFHWRFVGLSHNTIRGAAGGGILIAELLRHRGLLREA